MTLMQGPGLNSSYPYNVGKDSYLISFEGIEGAGKSTAISALVSFFSERAYQTLVLREPGGTALGEKLREAILSSKTQVDPMSEACLFAASRAQLLFEKTLPALKNNKTVVIYDRYIDSSLVYQGKARGLGIEAILNIHSHFPLTCMPHLTFYLKIDLETSLKRQQIRNKEKDYFEKETKEFYENLIQGYDELSEVFKERIFTIDATAERNEVLASLRHATENFLLEQCKKK